MVLRGVGRGGDAIITGSTCRRAAAACPQNSRRRRGHVPGKARHSGRALEGGARRRRGQLEHADRNLHTKQCQAPGDAAFHTAARGMGRGSTGTCRPAAAAQGRAAVHRRASARRRAERTRARSDVDRDWPRTERSRHHSHILLRGRASRAPPVCWGDAARSVPGRRRRARSLFAQTMLGVS